METLRIEHVPDVVRLHLAAWPRTELSIRLGAPFVRAFYKEVAVSPHAIGQVFVVGSTIAACGCGFHDYGAFNRRFAARHPWLLTGSMLRGLAARRIPAAELAALVRGHPALRELRDTRCHFGALTMANARSVARLLRHAKTPTDALADALHARLRERGAASVWSSTTSVNLRSQKFLERQGYVRRGEFHNGFQRIMLWERCL